MDQLKIKKIKPYPIVSQLTGVGAPFKVSIVKLTPVGFLAETEAHILQVHEKWDVQFALPVLNTEIKARAGVIKTYDSVPLSSGDKSKRMAELHFIKPTTVLIEQIEHFCRTIKQLASL